ncbi:MAG: GDP-mannose 4,6-dehydratase [Pelagibacteraceae bacterium TMED124]|nr:GDP-mannose 4,6-dehydratase [Candidatus Neomarinimicrobiota bacterium]RPG17206.1 MAG: GDP-mannose 4,6-dehydratase [Pelagibacteraceae bacterium TMED124]|tara:strand:+ start:1054 stop:2088 length:1035 start_codon:yes stop_codon:yes gene_type:complete
MKKKIALITGVTGQDGSHLADLLLKKKYKVIGLKRRSSSFNTKRIEHLYDDYQKLTDFIPEYGDLTDTSNIVRVIQKWRPDEIYNLAAQSHVHTSFEIPEYTANTNALGTLRILEAIRILKLSDKTKFYQASSSEIFGNSSIPQNEETKFKPVSPYASSKLYAYWITKNYRDAYGIFACNGILFNHEGPRRGETFVTRKITKAAVEIYKGSREILYLGNLEAQRDWGFAQDYVEAMWLMLQKKKPDDFVIATGKVASVKKFVEKTFKELKIEIIWKGKGTKEVGINKKNKKIIIKIDKNYYRPNEINILKGNFFKAKNILKWKPKTDLNKLIKIMVKNDLNEIK